MQKKLLATTIAASLALSGCALTLDPDAYQEVSMEKADRMPTADALAGKKEKIVIFPADNGTSNLAKRGNLGFSFATTLESTLADVGVEVVDRGAAKILQKELQLAESKGKAEYKGPEIADYAVTGQVSDASLSSTFHEKRTWEDDDGDYHERAAYCSFTATVSAQLKAYILPGLVHSKTIPVTGSSSYSTETTNSRCPISEASAISLAKKAVKKAISKKETQFKNNFAPKAYVLQRRDLDGESIFKLSSGTHLGLEGGADVVIYTKEVSDHPITGAITIEEKKIGEGDVADEPLGSNYSWIVIDDQEKANKIKLGDYVKRVHSRGSNEWLADTLGQ